MRKPKFWQTAKFKELEREWNERLARSGFRDAETTVNGRPLLKQRASNSYRGATLVERENKRRYYELLGVHAHAECFTDWVDCVVLHWRATGAKIKTISQILETLGERCHRETIRGIIRKYEMKWGIRR
jgi:hypothetical protein